MYSNIITYFPSKDFKRDYIKKTNKPKTITIRDTQTRAFLVSIRLNLSNFSKIGLSAEIKRAIRSGKTKIRLYRTKYQKPFINEASS